MKTNFFTKFILPLTFTVFLAFGCDTWDEDINKNPNTPPSTEDTGSEDYEPNQFMLDMLYSVIKGWDYIYWNVGTAVCEYHGKTISLSQGNRHQAWHAFDDSGAGGPWGPGYSAIRYIKNMREAAKLSGDTKYEAIADIWECYDFFGLTLIFGDVPYSQSLLDDAPIDPVYDRQEQIYYTLLNKLREAGESIDPTNQADAATDLIFSGDMSKWKKFANTLLIRYAMYMCDAAPDSASVLLNKIISDPATYPIMESNSDNALFHYDGSEYVSQMYGLSASKMDEAPFSNVFIERLVSLKDPRLPIYARPVVLVNTDSTQNVLPKNKGIDKYAGHIYGITSDNAYSTVWNNGANYASKLGEYFRTEDNQGNATSACATFPYQIATYSEMLFFLAEATERGIITGNITAKQYYEQAIQASFNQYGADFTTTKYQRAFGDESLESFTKYILQPDVAYNGGRDKLTLIAEQKWIASFLLGFEPYFDHRRTMLPQLRASSGAESYNATGSATKFPSRAAYPAGELSLNPINVANANATGFDIPIVDQETRNEALMWILQSHDQSWLQMPTFEEPVYPSEYPYRGPDFQGFGTDFYSWYTNNWNSMFWWK